MKKKISILLVILVVFLFGSVTTTFAANKGNGKTHSNSVSQNKRKIKSLTPVEETVDQNTKVLLHMNDNTFKDECGNTVTNHGVTVDTNDKEVGYGSASFNGIREYLTEPESQALNMGTGDFTVDMYIKCSDVKSGTYNDYSTVFKNQPGSNWGSGDICFHANEKDYPDKYYLAINGIGGIESKSKIKYNTWQHIDIVRHNGIIMIVVDDVIQGTLAYSGTINFGYNGGIVIGGKSAQDVSWFKGNIDEFRISDIARWTPSTGISLNKATDTLSSSGSNTTDTLTATVTQSNATNKTVKWTSSDESVAKVDQNGVVTAVGKGTATITATTTDGTNLSASCTVTVTDDSTTTPSNPTVGNRATLIINMVNGMTKEYDLSASELTDFLNWYDSRSKGTAVAYYTFTVPPTGPYLNKKDTIPFNMIDDYEVKEYNSITTNSGN